MVLICRTSLFNSWGQRIENGGTEHFHYLLSNFPGGSDCKEFASQCRRHTRQGFQPWVWGSLRAENGNQLQYFAWKIL